MNENNATNAIQTFVYKNEKTVRTVNIDGDVWFVAKDVADILEIQNIRQNLDTLDDEKGVSKIYTLGGMQDMTVISEAGLYTLMMRSNKKEAKPFRRWVTHEVLPSIRKTGSYSMPAVRYEDQDENDEQQKHLPFLSRGIKFGLDEILNAVRNCKNNDDFIRVIALDRAFQDAYGKSALEVMGIRLETEQNISLERWYYEDRPPQKDDVWGIRRTSYNYKWEYQFLPELPKAWSETVYVAD